MSNNRKNVFNNLMPQKSTIFLLFLFFLNSASNFVNGQTPQMNKQKYELYKDRLYSKFILIHDPLQYPPYGSWIPAHKRNPYSGFPTSQEIHWSDAGHTLGYFLATLATEYKTNTLNNNNLGKNECLNDMANVLRNLERLDYVAEYRYLHKDIPLWKLKDTTIYPYPYPKGYLNGFFIRDDINHPEFPIKQLIKQPEFHNTPKRFSDYGKHDEMSQDQVWNLLQGLALCAKLVDNPQQFIDGEGQWVSISRWAQKIANRTINALQTNFSFTVFHLKIPLRLWAIINPITRNVTHRGGKPTDLILNARLFSTAAAQILNQEDNSHYGFAPKIELSLPLKGYKHFNDHAKLALAVIGKTQYASSFDSILYWCHRCATSYNKDLPPDYQLFAYPHFPLMFLVLHEPKLDTQNYFYHYYLSYIEHRLNQAPMNGPWRGLFDENNDGKIDKDDHPEPFWSAGKRLVKPTGKDYTINPNDPATQPWEYNGLDYMLLYNLQELVKQKYFQTSPPTPLTEEFIFKGWQSDKGKMWKKLNKHDICIHPNNNTIPLQLFPMESNNANNKNIEKGTTENQPNDAPELIYKKLNNQLVIKLTMDNYYHKAEIINFKSDTIWTSIIKQPKLSIPLNKIEKGTPYLLILKGQNKTQYNTIFIQ